MPRSHTTLEEIIVGIGNPKTQQNLEHLLDIISSNKKFINLQILKSYDILRPLAFLAVEKENVDILSILVNSDQSLLSVQSQRDDETLLIRACKLLQIESVKCLLENGANPNQQNLHGNTAAMYAVYPQYKHPNYDLESRAILELLKKFNADFTLCDNDADTVFIESVVAGLPYTTRFLINEFRTHSILDEQLNHKNNEDSAHRNNGITTAFDGITKSSTLNDILYNTDYNKPKPLTVGQIIEKAQFTTGKYNSIKETQIKDLLLKSDLKTIQSLTKKVFVKKLVRVNAGPDTAFNNQRLLAEKAMDSWGNKFFTSKDINLLKLLIIAGTNLSEYQEFITGLGAISREEANEHLGHPSWAVILTEHQKEILDLIEASNCLLTFRVPETKEISSLVQELAIQQFFFLIQKDIEKTADTEKELNDLTSFIQDTFKVESEKLLPYLISKNGTEIECFKNYEEQISKICKDKNIIYDVRNFHNNFLQNIDIVTLEIQKILDPNFPSILPRGVALSTLNTQQNSQEVQPPSTYLDTYKKLSNFEWFKSIKTKSVLIQANDENNNITCKYYQEHPEALIPGLVLSHILENNSEQLKEKLLEPLNKISKKVSDILEILTQQYSIIKTMEPIYPPQLIQDVKDSLSKIAHEKFTANTELQEDLHNYSNMKMLISDLIHLTDNAFSAFFEYNMNEILEPCMAQYNETFSLIQSIEGIIGNIDLDSTSYLVDDNGHVETDNFTTQDDDFTSLNDYTECLGSIKDFPTDTP